jgi:hypothetical protein
LRFAFIADLEPRNPLRSRLRTNFESHFQPEWKFARRVCLRASHHARGESKTDYSVSQNRHG